MTDSTPSPGEPSDEAALRDLVDQVLRGAPAAIDAWFRSEHPAVYRLCFGFLADAEEAEDAAQDAMLHLLDHLDAWDAARPYRTWRNAVVANLCRDRLRGLDARRRAESGAAETVREPLPDPALAAQRGEVLGVLRGTLAELSPREREVFVLRDLEGVPTNEVADALAITASSVRSLLTLARRRLRTLLGDRLQGASDA